MDGSLQPVKYLFLGLQWSGNRIKAVGAAETVYIAQQMYQHDGHREMQGMRWLLLCHTQKLVLSALQEVEVVSIVSSGHRDTVSCLNGQVPNLHGSKLS